MSRRRGLKLVPFAALLAVITLVVGGETWFGYTYRMIFRNRSIAEENILRGEGEGGPDREIFLVVGQRVYGLSNRDGRLQNPWDLGRWGNFVDAVGPYPWHWVLPLLTAPKVRNHGEYPDGDYKGVSWTSRGLN